MRADQREQVRKILDYQSATARRELEGRRAALYAEHAAKGSLKSGATIRIVVRVMEEIGASFVVEGIQQVSAVAQDVEAFAALAAGSNNLWNWMAHELQSTINLASGRHATEGRSDSASEAATQLFESSRKLVRQKLELYRFVFTRSVASEIKSHGSAGGGFPADLPESSKRKGGRPLAEHWDDMWASIAFSLYAGQLAPKTQADIETAMHEWLEANGLSAAPSTVRGRARRLWSRIEVDI